MATTLSIEIWRESGFTYARAVGAEGCANTAATALTCLVDSLANKLRALEAAAHFNALSEDAVKEMHQLRGVFQPKEDRAPPVSIVQKK